MRFWSLGNLRSVRNPCSKTHCKGSGNAEKKDGNFKFLVADGTDELSGKHQVFRKSMSVQNHPVRDEGHQDVLRGESNESQPSDQQAGDKMISGVFSGSPLHRHHVELGVKLYVSNKDHSQYHSNKILTGGRIRHCMYCLKVSLMNIGKLMGAGNYQGSVNSSCS